MDIGLKTFSESLMKVSNGDCIIKLDEVLYPAGGWAIASDIGQKRLKGEYKEYNKRKVYSSSGPELFSVENIDEAFKWVNSVFKPNNNISVIVNRATVKDGPKKGKYFVLEVFRMVDNINNDNHRNLESFKRCLEEVPDGNCLLRLNPETGYGGRWIIGADINQAQIKNDKFPQGWVVSTYGPKIFVKSEVVEAFEWTNLIPIKDFINIFVKVDKTETTFMLTMYRIIINKRKRV